MKKKTKKIEKGVKIMNIQFDFWDDSNPYITTTQKKFWEIYAKYYCRQIEETFFFVDGVREWNGKKNKAGYKEILRHLAIEWQNDFKQFNYSGYELQWWEDFFETYGRKYGLLREFKENGII